MPNYLENDINVFELEGEISVGGGGTTNYEELNNLPQVNGVELKGNKTSEELGINIPTKTSDLNNDSGYVNSSIVANPYDETSTYAVGAYVTHENNLYKCNTAIATAEEWNAEHWTLVDVISAIPTKTSDLDNDSGFAVIDDTVTANDKAWSSGKISGEFANKALKTNLSEIYDSTKTYNFGDVANYNNKLYFCISTITTAETFDSNHWKEIDISFYLDFLYKSVFSDKETGIILDSLITIKGGIASTGAESNGSSIISSFRRSFFVKVYKGDVIEYKYMRGGSLNIVSYYNTNGVYVDGVLGDGTAKSGSYTVPNNGYVRLCGRNTELDRETNPTQVTLYSADWVTLNNYLQGIINNTYLPDYWQTYMNTKMPEITKKDALIGNNGDSFIFITDIHLPRNQMKSPMLLKYIFEHSAVKKLFNGGDILDINTGDNGKIEALESFQDWKSKVYGLNEINAVGNHDNNNFNGSNISNFISKPEWYGIMLKPLESVYTLDKATHYCIDNDTQKIRYIILDSEVGSGNYSDEVDYMQSKLTELDSSWSALVIQHRYWTSVGVVDTYGAELQNGINAIYDSLNCTFIGVIVGHLHADADTSDLIHNYPIIGVCCDSRIVGDSGYTRTIGTTTEQCFDVVHIDFTNRKIYLTRIGAGDTVVGGGTGVRVFDY